jgi:flagellar biosynthesis chaperone FliJ
MKEKLEQRLQELRSEFESGQKMLADLDAQRNNLQQTVLRISGAIQVLEELLESEESTAGNGVGAGNKQTASLPHLGRESRS